LQDAYYGRVIMLHPLVRFLGIAGGFRAGCDNISRKTRAAVMDADLDDSHITFVV